MELDNLKDIWQDADRGIAGPREEEIIALLGRRSRSPVARMKRNLLREFFMIAILYGALSAYYFAAFHGRLSVVGWFLIIIAIFFMVYYYKKYRLLMSMECISCHLRSNLESQVERLGKYTRFYLIAGTLLVPIAMSFLFLITYLGIPFTVTRPGNSVSLWEMAGVFGLITAISTVAIYFLNAWYVKRLYGRHIEKLRRLLKELKME